MERFSKRLQFCAQRGRLVLVVVVAAMEKSNKGDEDEKEGGRKNLSSGRACTDYSFMSIFVVSFMQDDDEDYNNDEDGRLSKSGNELKKLLGRLNKSDTEDDDDNDNADGDDDIDDVIDKDPLKAVPSGTSQITPSTSQGKRKSNDDEAKAYTGAPHKKAKTENGQKPSVKEEPASDSLVTEEIKAV